MRGVALRIAAIATDVIRERVDEASPRLGRERDEPERRSGELEVADEVGLALDARKLALRIQKLVPVDRPRAEAGAFALERRVGVDRRPRGRPRPGARPLPRSARPAWSGFPSPAFRDPQPQPCSRTAFETTTWSVAVQVCGSDGYHGPKRQRVTCYVYVVLYRQQYYEYSTE